jgi:hypothetical protein
VDGQQQQLVNESGAPLEEPLLDEEQEEGFDKSRTYWATWKGKDLAGAIDEKQQAYFETARNRGLLALWVIAYAAHHGLTPQDLRDFATQQIGFEGNELELIRFHINVTRSYVRQQSIMALGEKAAFKAMVVNSDHKSQVMAEMADKIINALYARYAEEHDGEVSEGDGVFGSCATHYRWDLQGGDEVSIDVPVEQDVTDSFGRPVMDATGKPQKQPSLDAQGNPITHKQKAKSGAPVITVAYPWSLVQETRSSGDPLWVVVREAESKWNLCSQFESLRDDILKQQTSHDQYDWGVLFRLEELEYANHDLCVVKHFYHARCPALPDGRYTIMTGDVVLWDSVCPVKEGVPVAMMRSSTFIETNFGYADSWDMLALNQALNQVNSDEMQNYSLYGRQSVAWEKGTNITLDGLTRGTGYEVPPGARLPQAISLTAIPGSLPDFKKYLHSMMDHESGQNSTSRGEPPPNIRSGEMAALMDSIALRYQSYRQQAARRFRIRGATILLDMLKRYGDTPFLVEISGIDSRAYVAEFTKEDLSGVQRITMDVVSPVMQTIAGRWQVYSMLKDLPPDQRAAAYELIATGDTSLFVQKDRTTELLIRRENEDLVTGKRKVFCSNGEDAQLHYQRHWAQLEQILASDDQDPDAVKRLTDHMAETVQNWFNASGAAVTLRGVTPPPVLGPTQDNPYGNPMYELQMQVTSAQQMLSGTGPGLQAPPPLQQQAHGPSAPYGSDNPPIPENQAQAGMQSGSAAQMNDQQSGQGMPSQSMPQQKHPSGTNLPQPSVPPGM